MDRTTAAQRKMEAEGKKMVKCKEDQDRLQERLEQLNDTYFELVEELQAAEAERDRLQLQKTPATSTTTCDMLRSFYVSTVA